jgi:hypothetical protein
LEWESNIIIEQSHKVEIKTKKFVQVSQQCIVSAIGDTVSDALRIFWWQHWRANQN